MDFVTRQEFYEIAAQVLGCSEALMAIHPLHNAAAVYWLGGDKHDCLAESWLTQNVVSTVFGGDPNEIIIALGTTEAREISSAFSKAEEMTKILDALSSETGRRFLVTAELQTAIAMRDSIEREIADRWNLLLDEYRRPQVSGFIEF